MKSFASLLLTPGKVPNERLKEIEDELRELCEIEEISKEKLKEISKLNAATLNPDYRSHEELIVEKLGSDSAVNSFIKRWRVYFVQSLNPQHLPPYWSVDHEIVKN